MFTDGLAVTAKMSDRSFVRQHRELAVVGVCQLASFIFIILGGYLLVCELVAPASSHWRVVDALIFSGVATLIQCVSALYGRRELHKIAVLSITACEAQEQADALFDMADMLQSAEGYEDASAILAATTQRLLPDHGVALYIFNNSRDRLDLAGSWNMPDGYCPSDFLAPSNCWTLKRGKPHSNDPSSGTLCCSHHIGNIASLEMPMMARGVVYGLLIFTAAIHSKSRAKPADVGRLGAAIGDSMSLALSNISLRERLQTQSLRDPLTGLYNRRYMEDALERLGSLGERDGTSVAVMMLDLDNFKHLNDEHGHAKGDQVLRDVASQLVGGSRPSDVVCRYGGEELMIILPNCSLEDAAAKAEAIRMRIASVSELHGMPISVSIGVAAIPETSTTTADLMSAADAALYTAKREGKNKVVCAQRRTTSEQAQRPLKAIV